VLWLLEKFLPVEKLVSTLKFESKISIRGGEYSLSVSSFAAGGTGTDERHGSCPQKLMKDMGVVHRNLETWKVFVDPTILSQEQVTKQR